MNKLTIIVAAIATIALTSCNSMPKAKEAFIISKQIIEAQANLPKLDFPLADYRYDITNDSLYTIESHFDTNNTRVNYRIKMYYMGGSWSKLSSWELKDIKTWQ